MEGVIWDDSVPILKSVLEETSLSGFENFIPIMIHYDVHKISSSPPA